MIYSYCINGKSARECHDALFLGSDQICKLKNVQKIFNLGNDSTKEKAKIEYLSHCHHSRGPQGDVFNNGQWYDDIIKALSTNYPTVSIRQHLKCVVRRIDITWLQLRFIITWYCNFLVYSINRMRKYIKRRRFQCLS